MSLRESTFNFSSDKGKEEEDPTPKKENECELFEPLHYESHYLLENRICQECGSTKSFTRIYFHKESLHSTWLCYNCASDYVDYRGYEILTHSTPIDQNRFHSYFEQLTSRASSHSASPVLD